MGRLNGIKETMGGSNGTKEQWEDQIEQKE
jgi:hypothetical protein